jgi:hypothetical protein
MATNPLTPLLGEGCCASCGFLSHSVSTAAGAYNFGRVQTVFESEIFDVPIYMRASGSDFGGSFRDPSTTHIWTWAAPLCFIFAAEPSLSEEVGFDPSSHESLDRKTVASAIQREDRKCPKWFEWRPGISPAEHVRMRDMIELERDRRKWEADVETERRASDERLDKSNKVFLSGLESERREWEKQAGRWPNRLIWAAVILAIGQVLAGVLALPLITRLLHLD